MTMESSLWPITGIFGLLLLCLVLFIGFAIAVAALWLYIACLLDALKKTEEEMPNRTIWIVVLIVTFFTGFSFIPSIVYYFLYNPKLDFWK
jgi:hypothetical protein